MIGADNGSLFMPPGCSHFGDPLHGFYFTENKFDDYSSLVHEMCRVYESIIKTVFLSAGVPERLLTKEYFYTQKNPTILDRSVLPQLKDDDTRKRLAKIYKPYRAYRNPSSHGAANDLKTHQVIRTYEGSEDRCKKVAAAMIEFYEIVKPYFL